MRRAWIILLVLLLIGGALGGIYFGTQRHQGPVLPLPADTQVIVGINVSSLTKIFVKDYLFHRDSYEQFFARLQGSGQVPPLFGNLMETGLRLNGTILAYQFPPPSLPQASCWALPMRIEDPNSFASWIDSTATKYELHRGLEGDIHWAYADQARVGWVWRETTVLFLYGLTAKEIPIEGKEQLNLSPDNALSSKLAGLEEFLEGMDHASFGSWHRAATPEKSIWYSFVQHFHFRNGRVEQEVRLTPNLDFDGPLVQGGEIPSVAPGPLTLETHFHPNWLDLNGNLEEGGFMVPGPLSNFLPQLAGWAGSLNLSITGWQTVQQTYTSYDFDDDFNRIPIVRQKEVQLPSVEMILKMRSEKALREQLNQWGSQNLLVQEGGDRYFQVDSSYRFDINQRGDLLFFHNNGSDSEPSSQRSDEALILSFRADLENLFETLSQGQDQPLPFPLVADFIELGEEVSLELKEDQGHVLGIGEWELKDKSRNALPQLLLHFLPQMSLPL